MSLQVINFYIKKKIILLCLPPYSTHLLQPCDVGVFGPLSQTYKEGIRERFTFTKSCTIKKVDFLEIWHPAREKAMTEKNIRSTWRKAGYLTSNKLVDLDVVLS